MMPVGCVKGWDGDATRAVGYSEQQIGISFVSNDLICWCAHLFKAPSCEILEYIGSYL
jgi:hypothetical protein